MRIALCFQKWKPVIWVDAVISGWTSVNSVSHNAGSLSTQFINFFGCKIKLFHNVFSLNYVMISTNNKMRNENPASTDSLTGSKRIFSTFHLSSTRTNQRTCCELAASISTCRDWCRRFATRFSTKKVKSMSQTCMNLSKTRLQTWSKTRFAAG